MRELLRSIVKNLPRQFALRSYQSRDREAVRQICCETANCGEPMDDWFPDREIFADFLMRYYTDWEPRSLLVATVEGRVVGYLAACHDSARFRRIMAWRVVPATLWRALWRGTLWHPKVRALLRTNWRTFRWRGGIRLENYPAHIHINIRRGYRDTGIGRLLFHEWLRRAKASGLIGVHAGVNSLNTRARSFFETMGFKPIGRDIGFCFPGNQQPLETIIYGLLLVEQSPKV